MNATTSKKCPSCGKKYKKRSPLLTGCLVVVVAAIVVIVVIVVAIGGAASSLDQEQKAHAISQATFESTQLGWTEAQVKQHAGKEPENRQEFESKSFVGNEPQNSSCFYYNKEGGNFGDVFQFCFTNGKLDSKNAY